MSFQRVRVQDPMVTGMNLDSHPLVLIVEGTILLLSTTKSSIFTAAMILEKALKILYGRLIFEKSET
jgi:hypothetical protein